MNYYCVVMVILGISSNISAAEKGVLVRRPLNVDEESPLIPPLQRFSSFDGNSLKISSHYSASTQHSAGIDNFIARMKRSDKPYAFIFTGVHSDVVKEAMVLARAKNEDSVVALFHDTSSVSPIYRSGNLHKSSPEEEKIRERAETLLISYMMEALQHDGAGHKKRHEEEVLAHHKTKRKNRCITMSMGVLTVLTGFLGHYISSNKC